MIEIGPHLAEVIECIISLLALIVIVWIANKD